jgi:hypothetical protein
MPRLTFILSPSPWSKGCRSSSPSRPAASTPIVSISAIGPRDSDQRLCHYAHAFSRGVFHESIEGKVLESVLTDMRKFTGRQLADFCQSHMPACFGQVLRQAAGDDRERRFWQSTRHPESIESEDLWQRKVDYLHENPCHKGLVSRPDYWRFSSAAYWLSDGQMENEVTLKAIDW